MRHFSKDWRKLSRVMPQVILGAVTAVVLLATAIPVGGVAAEGYTSSIEFAREDLPAEDQGAVDETEDLDDQPGAGGLGGTPPTDIGNVVRWIPSPDASPNGLAWDGTYLWNSGLATAKIYKVEGDGNIISSIPSPAAAPADLAWDGTYLWNVDIGTDTVYKLNPSTGAIISQFSSASFPAPEGLAWDGTDLWLGCAGTDTIYRVTTGGGIVDQFPAPGTAGGADGLAWDGTHLWICGYDNVIYKCDTSGNVLASFPTPGTSPNGLTYNGACLWNDDSSADKLYQICTVDICGDVNRDCKVNMADVMVLWYDIADYPSPGAWTISNEWAADVNCDGKINMADVMILWYDIADYPSPGAWQVNCCE